MGTRCFGYAIPELSLVPFADNANHHTTDNQYELFNSRLATKLAHRPEVLTEHEQCYNTTDRKKVDFLRNFPVERLPEEFKTEGEALLQRKLATGHSLSVKAARYARKLEKRHRVHGLTPAQFLEDGNLVDKDIWELGYASTSDEDDNDE